MQEGKYKLAEVICGMALSSDGGNGEPNQHYTIWKMLESTGEG